MEFQRFADQPDDEQDLLLGALLLAKDAYPALDLSGQRRRFDALELPSADGQRAGCAMDWAEVLGNHVFGRLGFRGNEEDYYDVRNSYLNDVLDRGLGIPITLAVVYIEIARRAGVRASGVNFPGHFLVRIEDPTQGPPVFVDPFHGGGTLQGRRLESLWVQMAGGNPARSLPALHAATVRQIVTRMLMNLRAIHASRGDFRALYLVLDRIVALLPDSAPEIRDRGLLSMKLGAPEAARRDLRRYLRLSPGAEDVAEVRRVLDSVRPSDLPN
ncbi:MAG: transglutaminase-like domain-containing protein [Polyangiaceae bacterium]